MIRTLLIFSNYQELPRMLLVDGDKRHFDGVTINCGPEERWQALWEERPEGVYEAAEKELTDLLYGGNTETWNVVSYREENRGLVQELSAEDLTFSQRSGSGMAPWNYVAFCGFAP